MMSNLELPLMRLARADALRDEPVRAGAALRSSNSADVPDDEFIANLGADLALALAA
jgi:hypothetical protein